MVCLVLLLGAIAWPAAAADDAPRIFPYKAHVETLDNGLQVILVPMSSGGLVAYWTLMRTGSRDEFEAGRSGFAHFFEHMMFRGTEKYPAALYQSKLTSIGADANAFTTDDFTAYHLGITKEDVELVMELESDRFQHLDYPRDMFQTEAGAVYGEYRKDAFEPLLRDVRSDPQDRLRAAHLRPHHPRLRRRHPGHAVALRPLAVVFQPLLPAGKRHPADRRRHRRGSRRWRWPRSITVRGRRATRSRRSTRSRSRPPSGGSTFAYEGSSLPILWLAYKNDAFDPASKRLVSLQLLCDLAFGETSAIHKKLVLDQQLVEFVNCENNWNRDPNLVDITGPGQGCRPRSSQVKAELEATIARFQKDPPSADQLKALAVALQVPLPDEPRHPDGGGRKRPPLPRDDRPARQHRPGLPHRRRGEAGGHPWMPPATISCRSTGRSRC